MKVLKFGGTSVANPVNISKAIKIILEAKKKKENIVVVVSALGGVTDELLQLAALAGSKNNKYQSLFRSLYDKHNKIIKSLIKRKSQKPVLLEVKNKYTQLEQLLQGIALIGEVSPRSLDAVASFGEQLSAYIISQAIRSRVINCKFVDSRSLIKTDNNFGSAQVDIKTTYNLLSGYFKNLNMLSVMGGFIASTQAGITTTLGRGGSDYTASLVGAALKASVIEIWTDVDGVMTADPRKVRKAFPLTQISYEEAGELAHFGAKVIHPKTMRPAQNLGIPILIKNTFNPEAKGTIISNTKTHSDFLIKGISTLSNISLLRLHYNNGHRISAAGARVYSAFNRAGIEILLVTQASYEQSISIAVSSKDVNKAKEVLATAFELEFQTRQMPPVSFEENLSIVAIVGKQMKGMPGISGKLFSTLGNNKINIVAIAQGSSELNVSAVINAKDELKVTRIVHEAFFNPGSKSANVFLVGTGLIGSMLLKQAEALNSQINLCGVANAANMLIDEKGISLSNWNQKLAKGKRTSIDSFIKQMISFNLPNSIFVDCTASAELPEKYESILSAGIAIVTPNKKANSNTYPKFQQLQQLSKSSAPFLYKTNVGGGLPIIPTLQSLIASGDEVVKIEAVLSGTLSYIFNTYSDSSESFSSIVRQAKAKGFTEPDPRDDLNGMDVARKILILARELGLKMELKQVKSIPLLPPRVFKVKSIEAFFESLEKLDTDFEKKKIHAQKTGKVLRYIATLYKGKASISLQEVGPLHQAYHLSGNDNIVSITTKRYRFTPLVIKGPGAGAEVTAGGVLADVLSLLK